MGVRITEKKRIDIEQGCVANPVYLNWMSTPGGGREYWLFGVTQSKKIDTSVSGTFSPFIEDNTNAKTYLQEMTRGAFESMTLGANVPKNKIDGLKTLVYSLNVLFLTNPDTWVSEGPKWVQVFPVVGSFSLGETAANTIDFQFTIRFNEINIQSY